MSSLGVLWVGVAWVVLIVTIKHDERGVAEHVKVRLLDWEPRDWGLLGWGLLEGEALEFEVLTEGQGGQTVVWED